MQELFLLALLATAARGQCDLEEDGLECADQPQARSLNLLRVGFNKDIPTSVPFSKYPIWKVHKYHGIDLRPVELLDTRTPLDYGAPPEPKRPDSTYDVPSPAASPSSSSGDTDLSVLDDLGALLPGGEGGDLESLASLASLLTSKNGEGKSLLDGLTALSGLLQSKNAGSSLEGLQALLPVLGKLKNAKPQGFRTTFSISKGVQPQRISKRSLLLPKKLALLGALAKLNKHKHGFSFNPFSPLTLGQILGVTSFKDVITSIPRYLFGFGVSNDEQPEVFDASTLPALPALPAVPVLKGFPGLSFAPKVVFQPVGDGKPYVYVRYPHASNEQEAPPPPPPTSVAYHASQVIPQLQIQIAPYPVVQGGAYEAPPPLAPPTEQTPESEQPQEGSYPPAGVPQEPTDVPRGSYDYQPSYSYQYDQSGAQQGAAYYPNPEQTYNVDSFIPSGPFQVSVFQFSQPWLDLS